MVGTPDSDGVIVYPEDDLVVIRDYAVEVRIALLAAIGRIVPGVRIDSIPFEYGIGKTQGKDQTVDYEGLVDCPAYLGRYIDDTGLSTVEYRLDLVTLAESIQKSSAPLTTKLVNLTMQILRPHFAGEGQVCYNLSLWDVVRER